MATGWQIPQINTNFHPLQLPYGDPLRIAAQLAKGNSALARAIGGAVRGGRAARPTTQQVFSGQFDAAGNPIMVEVPKGMTQKERAQYLGQVQQNKAAQVFQNDPVVAEKLARLSTVPVGEQSKILEDIRRNDISRLTKASGIPSSELFTTILEPFQDEVRSRTAEVGKSSGLSAVWDSLKIGGHGLSSALSAIMQGGSAEQLKTSAEEHKQYRDKVLADNAFLKDQELRAQQGEGLFSRMTGPGSSILGTVGAALGETLPSAGVGIGGAIGGAALGTAVGGPVGGVVGGLLGGAAPMAGIEPFNLAQRVVNDPNLSEQQKTQAISEGTPQAMALGAATGAIPVAVGAIGRPLIGAAARAGLPGAARLLEPAAGAISRYGRRVGTTAAELEAMNLTGTTGQNVIYGQVTGQNVPVFEGAGEALAQGLLAAPFFGLIPRGQARPTPNAPPVAPETATAGAAPVRPSAPVEAGVPQEFARTFRSTLKEGLESGVPIDPAAVRQSFYDAGFTPEQYRNWIDTDAKLVKSARLGGEVTRLLNEDFRVSQLPPSDAALKTFVSEVKSAKDETGILEAYDKALQSEGVDSAALARAVDADKRMGKWKRDVINNRIETERVLDVTTPESVATVEPDATGRAASEAAILEPDVQGREATAPATDPGLGGRAAADTEAVIAAAPAAGVAELAGSDRAIESGRLGGAAEPNVRPGEAVDVSAQVARDVAPVRADAGSSVGPAAAPDAARGQSAGSLERAVVRDARATVDAARPGPALEPTEKIRQEYSKLLSNIQQKETAGKQPTVKQNARRAELEQTYPMLRQPEQPVAPDVIVRKAAKNQAPVEEPRPITEMDTLSSGDAAALEQAGIAPDMAALQQSFELPGETPLPRSFNDSDFALRFARSSLSLESPERLAPILGLKTLKTSEQINNAQSKGMEILVKEALGENLTSKEMNAARYMHNELGFTKVNLPTDVKLQYANARAEGLDVNTVEIAEAAMDPDVPTRKILERLGCQS